KEDVKKKEEESKPKGKDENKDELKQAVEKGEEQFKHANSVTHKAEYDKFSRQCLDRKKFPVSLAPHYMKDKLDVFRAWLQASEQWDAVEVIYERRAERRSKDLYHKYPKEKADGLMRKLKEKGMWYYDPDFDGDEEEIFYYACEGNVLSDESVFVESTTVKGKEVGNKELVEALTGEGGPLAAGAIAGAATATEDEAEKMEPKTVIDQARDNMETCLKKAAEARKHALSLSGTGYGGDLSTQLMNFSAKMEAIYKILQDVTARKVMDEESYMKHFKIITDKTGWYEKAE
ncbi:unnamed protein product, partial [Durusdinium trenchii]